MRARAGALPSWHDGATKQAIVDFIAEATYTRCGGAIHA
jgi:hypothetical protein